MKLITAVIQRNKLEPVTKALAERGVGGLTVMDVQGYGSQKGRKEVFRGKTYETTFLPKTRIDVIVPAEEAEAVIDTIVAAAKTGSIGDGKVWASPLTGLVRVRTGEHGPDAI
ncbi:P-II family nitrogen regulator [Nesterenkonia aurantiaca]|uniref:Nitrogen regulatory protein P-II family n=1 Tax=Nesterenkonia aurantiaca TaxID=1436010 RepID=A0A4R7G8H9_9MICC|nr:P-II family nitrogen regulator [Nesterenkonia aurantiaca]TDS87765.1 nitrogen regulatory protein P-II family [Nesterenkonia aurantiaca]